MAKLSKRQKAINEKVQANKAYAFEDAATLLAEVSSVKFVESVDVSVNLGVDPRKSDQVVRGATLLPHGTGKTVRVAVFTQGANAEAALAAGAEWRAADRSVPAPNPKVGTVAADVGTAVKNAKAGQVRYRTDKNGIIHCSVGKVGFDAVKLKENVEALISDLKKAKPSTSKGIYLQRVTLSTTMGPGIEIDHASLTI